MSERSSPDRPKAGRALRTGRIAFEIAALVIAIALVLGVGRGLASVAPGLAAAIRFLLHPLTFIVVVATALLLRARTQRPKTASDRTPRSPS